MDDGLSVEQLESVVGEGFLLVGMEEFFAEGAVYELGDVQVTGLLQEFLKLQFGGQLGTFHHLFIYKLRRLVEHASKVVGFYVLAHFVFYAQSRNVLVVELERTVEVSVQGGGGEEALAAAQGA